MNKQIINFWENNKIGLIIGFITLAILAFGAYSFSKPTKVPELTSYEYFWGNGCPHCKLVDEFYTGWSGKDKINIKKFEVWNNTKNAELMALRAAKCNIQRSGMGVPLLVTPDGKCLIGDQPIIEHYKSLNY